MDKPRLKLKEQQPAPVQARIGARFSPPKPVSVFQRLAGALKRLCGWLIFLAVALAVFLCVPFRSWDDSQVWLGVRDSMERLSARPDSLPEFRSALSVANSAGLLWSKPTGARPVKWYQVIERERFDASYSVVQALAVGVVMHGKAERGLAELEQLKRRTGLKDGLSELPDTTKIAPVCSRCQGGAAKCAACGGSGKCAKCDGKGSLTSSKVERREGLIPAKRMSDGAQKMEWKCPVCGGSAQCAVCKGEGTAKSTCAACGGSGFVVDYRAATNVFRATVQGSLSTIDAGQSHRQAIHALADVQRLLLRKGMGVGQTPSASEPLVGAASADGASPAPGAVASGASEVPSTAAAPRADSAGASSPKAPGNAQEALVFGQGAADEAASRGSALPLEARLLLACGTLQRSPLDVAALTTLSEAAREAVSMPEVRGRAMAAYALAHLMRGDTNSFAMAVRIHDAEYPGQGKLLTVTPGDCLTTCEECAGVGDKFTPCPSCTGPNSCPVCKGKGVVPAGDDLVPCKSCKYKPVCKMCEGQRKMLVRCATCKGVGRVFKLSPRVQGNFESLVGDLAAHCREEVAFGEQLAKASGEKDLGLRIRLLQAATNQFAGRVNLARATGLFAAAATEEQRGRAGGGAKPPPAQVASLPSLPVDVPIEVALLDKFERAQDVGAAVDTLRGYLAEHPAAPGAGDVRKVLGRLERRQQRGLAGRMGAAGAAVVVLGSVCLLSLRRAKVRRHAHRTIALPGMGRIDTDAFTDPLSLTAQESRSAARECDGA